MTRFLSVLVLAVSLSGCAAHEFEQEFWLRTDGSGSFSLTAPLWVWNAVKNVGDARNLETTVNVESVGALFKDPAILDPHVKAVTRGGDACITVTADFQDINALVGTRGFPDLVVAMRPEGRRLRMFGVWRRPQFAGNAQGNDTGLMAVRFHIPSEIFEHRNATLGVERGNVLSWQQTLSSGLAGAPLDFGATIGTRSVLRATPAVLGLMTFGGVGAIALVLSYFLRRGRRRRRRTQGPGSGTGSPDGANFLNYDRTSGAP